MASFFIAPISFQINKSTGTGTNLSKYKIVYLNQLEHFSVY